MSSGTSVIIVGGGLAGLSTACYALASGLDVLVVENDADSVASAALPHGRYLLERSTHWLTGDAFGALYEELGIVPRVELRTLEHFLTYRHERDGYEVAVTRDLGALAAALGELAPEDADEIDRLVLTACDLHQVPPPRELSGLHRMFTSLGELQHRLGTLETYRHSVATWAAERLHSERLRRFFVHLVPPSAPSLLVPLLLGHLKHGHLARPIGGTAELRGALVDTFVQLGGCMVRHARIEQILVDRGAARGVLLADGTVLAADAVVSTSSGHETVAHVLDASEGAEEVRRRLGRVPPQQPLVIACFGLARPLPDLPPVLLVDGIEPFRVAGHDNDALHVRVYHDEPHATPGRRTAVQVLLATGYDWWTTIGGRDEEEKERAAEIALAQLARRIPGLREVVRSRDVAPLLAASTLARAWGGAVEGWMPDESALVSRLPSTPRGRGGLYLAGQWIEPAGGAPSAIMSGRIVVQLLCHDLGVRFAVPTRRRAATSAPLGSEAVAAP